MPVGLTHYYYGDGKGKTSAAMGLALRTAGHGLRVMIVQFFKTGNSGEVAVLKHLPGVTVVYGQSGKGFSHTMSDAQKKETTAIHDANLRQAIDAADDLDVLILDEAMDAYQLGYLDKAPFDALMRNKPPHLELVITGHQSDEWLCRNADYVTRFVKEKHPFDSGVTARKGIEI